MTTLTIIQKTIFKFHLNTAMLMIFLAVLKLFICLHCCHTLQTFLLALNPLKVFRINKERLSMMSIIEYFSEFFRDYRAF